MKVSVYAAAADDEVCSEEKGLANQSHTRHQLDATKEVYYMALLAASNIDQKERITVKQGSRCVPWCATKTSNS